MTERPAFNVRDYGARGDGVTDDWPAFEAAMVAAEATDHPVYVPPGTYKLENE